MIEYPVLLNSNGQIQDKNGQVLLTICNFFVKEGAKEFGEDLVERMNNVTSVKDSLSNACPGEIIHSGLYGKLVMVKEDEWSYFQRLKCEVDSGRMKIESNGNGHKPCDFKDHFKSLLEKDITESDRKKMGKAIKLVGRLEKKYSGNGQVCG